MIYLTLGVFCSAAMSVVLKIFSESKGNRFGIILGNYLTCIVLAFCFLPDKAAVLRFPTAPLLWGALGGCFYVGGIVTMQSSILKNGAAVTAAFAKLGLVAAVGVSLLFGEKPGVLQFVGIVLAVAAAVFMQTGQKAETGKTGKSLGAGALLLFFVWATGGGGEAMAKVFDELGRDADKPLYLFSLFSTAALLSGVFAVVEGKRTGKKLLPKEALSGVAVGAANYLSSFFLLLSLHTLPGTLSYPVYSGGAILVVTLISVLFFREKPTVRQYIGLAGILVSLVLLNLP